MKQKLSDQIKYVLRSDPLIDEAIALEQELDAARLEVERLYTAIKKITKLNAIDAGIYTTGKIDAICKEALAAQQDAI